MTDPSSFQWDCDFEPSRTHVSSYTKLSELENLSCSQIIDPAANRVCDGLRELLHSAGVIQEELIRHETLLLDCFTPDTAENWRYSDDLKCSVRNLNKQTKRLIGAVQRTSQEVQFPFASTIIWLFLRCSFVLCVCGAPRTLPVAYPTVLFRRLPVVPIVTTLFLNLDIFVTDSRLF
ncbi:uncharacterized protein DEA37_0014549 [Paragonimus westermani]|uniref:Uncharacterized protein n=1 Tax=Paragonimus westermani TaxID=34504 RepID=A0A5J4NJ79_9TREM|nr:uncharacterized protein DEA37_0014549 [Paragonimus westermani]